MKEEGKTSGESEVLGWRRATHRWADDPVRRMYILVQRRSMPRWEEYPVRWKSGGLEKQRRRDNMHITMSDRV